MTAQENKLTFRTTSELHSKLKKEAEEKNTSVNKLMIQIIEEFFEHDEEENEK